MEIEYHFLRHNTSIFFASPSLIVQGTFLNPDELGHTVRVLQQWVAVGCRGCSGLQWVAVGCSGL